MPARSDDFTLETKELLAKRVGMRCSGPNCRKPTSGPSSDQSKVVNIGVASHITAASKGGPRYDAKLTPADRKSFDNGIWLCQNCGKLVDNDAIRYTVDLLRAWKRLAEEAALLDVESMPNAKCDGSSDVDMIRFFAQCFDRPAFQDEFRQEGSMEAFDKAIEDTITAINTGCLRSRDGSQLAQGRGKSYLTKKEWREQMDTIVDMLRAIRSRYDLARRMKLISVGEEQGGGRAFYCFSDRGTADWMDCTRQEVLKIFAEIAQEAGVHPPRMLSQRHRP